MRAKVWQTLQRELDLWAESDATATFWWRDDDAVSESPQLHTLDALSRELNVPVAVAVVPAQLDGSLPRYLRDRDNFTVLQHGYSHTSYAARGVKKIEVVATREQWQPPCASCLDSNVRLRTRSRDCSTVTNAWPN